MICCLIVRLIIIIHWWEKTVGPIFLYPLITRLKAYLNDLPFFLCLCSSDSWKLWYWKKMNSLYSYFFTMPLPQAVAKESLQMCTQLLPPQLWAACSHTSSARAQQEWQRKQKITPKGSLPLQKVKQLQEQDWGMQNKLIQPSLVMQVRL